MLKKLKKTSFYRFFINYITGDNLIRRILIKRHGLTYGEIINKISTEKPDVVSFDMFDTLIKRTLFRPNELFEILERDFRDKFVRAINTINLKELRINAEREAKQYANIYDIYDGITVLSSQEKKWCLQHEIDLELAMCIANPEMKEVYQWCKDRNIRIVIASDMYLPSTVLGQILQKAGYSGWENIFVSNECSADKSSGNLFIYIKEKLNKNKILHIGDAFNADYVKARNVVTACLYKCTLQNPKYYNRSLLKKSLNYRILNFFIKYSEYSDDERNSSDSYEKLGYECLGPLLYGYSKWLYSKIKKYNIKKVFFLAREGVLLEKAFQIVCTDADIAHCLIRVSRQSTCIPLLYSAKNLEEVLAILPKNRLGYTVREFLNFCGIPDLEKDILRVSSGEYLSKSENKFWEIIEKYIKVRSLEQKEYILSYLQKRDFRGNVAVADVGWCGTIQNNLSKIVKDVNIAGFYFGTNASLNITTEAYLFDSTHGDEIRSDIYTSPRIFEMFFLSLDGSTRGYDGSGALLAQPEQETEASVKIKKMQDSALAFVRKFSEFTQYINLGFDKYDFSANYRKFVNPPSRETLQMFKGFYFVNTERKNSLVNEHTLMYYLFHLKEFKYEFINSGCKPWFVRSVFHIPLNYAKILNKIRKL